MAARERALAASTFVNMSNSFFWTSWCSHEGLAALDALLAVGQRLLEARRGRRR